jgi:hypothetical protein
MFRNAAYAARSCRLAGEVGFPLHGNELLLLIVAFLAAGNDITFGGFSASGDGYDVIHGELFGLDRATAVITDAFVTFSFPPLGVAYLPRFVTFPLDVVFRKIICVWIHL